MNGEARAGRARAAPGGQHLHVDAGLGEAFAEAQPVVGFGCDGGREGREDEDAHGDAESRQGETIPVATRGRA